MKKKNNKHPTPLRVCLAGVTGWMGRPLAPRIAARKDMTMVSAVARTTAGRTLRDVLADVPLDVVISGTVRQALETPADVFIDLTSAAVVYGNVMAAVERGLHVVVGSSGLNDEQYATIDAEARKRDVGVVAIANFAASVMLLQRFAVEAAKYFPAWEIIHYASSFKPDAPSGTACETAGRLSRVKAPHLDVPVENHDRRQGESRRNPRRHAGPLVAAARLRRRDGGHFRPSGRPSVDPI